jgi:hypothetical protein
MHPLHPVQRPLQLTPYPFVGLFFESRLDGISRSFFLDLTQDPGGPGPDVMIRMSQRLDKFGDRRFTNFRQGATGRINVDKERFRFVRNGPGC